MIERLGGSDLSALRHSGPDLMTFVASHLLMFGVTETNTECLGKFRGARITT
jgi:hypothetical protein